MNEAILKIKRIFRALKNGTFFEKIKNRLIILRRNKIIKNVKINSNKIVFLPFQGRYECNAKAIANELLKEKTDLELVWIAKSDAYKKKELYPKEIKVIEYGKEECYKELASAKVIIINAIDLAYLKYQKKDNQYIIQTWHGSMGFKKLYTDGRSKWRKNAYKLAEETDYIICNSTFEEEVYRESYWKNTPFLKYGHPRNDILVNKKDNKELNTKIRKKYNIKENSNILLYAPTFRQNLKIDVYDLDYNRLKKSLEKKFGGTWTILVRLHYKVIKDTKKIDKIKDVINVSEYPDMQELLSISDIGITDYSSWMCDYVLTRKPGFLYAPDFEEYRGGRGFYYPLETTPFKICKNNNDLEEAINNFDNKLYQKEIDKFLNDRGCYEKGNASILLVEFIKKIIKK